MIGSEFSLSDTLLKISLYETGAEPVKVPSASPLFSPGGEAKCVRGPSVQGARRSARGGVLEQYVEHGEQAQRRNGGPIMCFDRQLVRNAG